MLLLWVWFSPIGAFAISLSQDKIDLSGEWDYRLSGAPASIPGEGVLTLPSTLDESHKSVYNPEGDNTSQLRREFSFSGEALYSRKVEIPSRWKNKRILLHLERTKPSRVTVDGKPAGENSRISSPHHYDLTDYLTPGRHTIEIAVNNADSIPPIVARSSNAVSEATQTNWNGILGEISLEAKNHFAIRKIQIDDSKAPRSVKVTLYFTEESPEDMTVTASLDNRELMTKRIIPGSETLEMTFPVDADKLWSAISPTLQELSLVIKDKTGKPVDVYTVTTGFRNFSQANRYFTVNGNPVFMRGTVNAAIFPKTGYSPTDLAYWEDYFSTIKEYGLNHVRFHSWTPPEAAFEAADKAGVYILTELPIWGELDRDLNFHNRFLEEELTGIMEEYSHHPSFVMFSPGNELWGDISLMGDYMKSAKAQNPRILSTYGSNVYLGMNGEIGGEDFIISAKTSDDPEKSVRGSVSFADSSTGGHLNSTYPNSDYNFGVATRHLTIPLIAHEVGQYQSYPDFTEIEKYTGNLKADNLKEFRQRAMEAGTYRKSKEFKESSGKWAAKLYKAEMEMSQRTPGMAGFELFGLEDYTGQGTALVGVLNPFMESKGFITPETWRQSASDIAILAEFPKFSFSESENLEIPILLVNFTEKTDPIKTIHWSIESGNTSIGEGDLEAIPGNGVLETGALSYKLPKLSDPQKMTLRLSGDNGTVTNAYEFYVYPSSLPEVKNVFVTDNLNEALSLLDKGERVLLCPDPQTVENASIPGLFTTDFWNYRMFRTICDEMNLTPSPGTLGLYINEKHPSFQKFPTDSHTDWQWYPIIANSRPLIIDRLPRDFDPIVEVIDNVERNFRLSLMLECNVGKGKLVILSTDVDKISQYPEGRWLLQSVKEYMGGKDFKPEVTLSRDQIVNLVTKPSTARLIKELKNETYNSKWD